MLTWISDHRIGLGQDQNLTDDPARAKAYTTKWGPPKIILASKFNGSFWFWSLAPVAEWEPRLGYASSLRDAQALEVWNASEATVLTGPYVRVPPYVFQPAGNVPAPPPPQPKPQPAPGPTPGVTKVVVQRAPLSPFLIAAVIGAAAYGLWRYSNQSSLLDNVGQKIATWKETGTTFDRGKEFAHLRRQGEKFRWYSTEGRTVGPIHRDFPSAIAYAEARGWHDVTRDEHTPADVTRVVHDLVRQGRGIFRGQSSKVYVADVLAALPSLRKADLLSMHRRGEIELTRLDLVQAAIESGEEQRLRASTIQDGFAEYQLVSVRRS